MKNKKRILRISCFIFALAFALTFFVPCAVVFAEDSSHPFDNSNVLDDLNGSTVLGKKFSVDDYPRNLLGQPQLLSFAEFCFSTDINYASNYGLFLYVYNPSGVQIEDSSLNCVTMGSTYDAGNNVTANKQFGLHICNYSSDFLFYKFRILDVGSHFARCTSATVRRYDIVSLLLKYEYSVNALAYDVGGTYCFTGYAQGMNFESLYSSTLKATQKSFDVLRLTPSHTYYRLQENEQWFNQLNSVYFSVPSSIASNYDRLYRVQASTYEYLTSPMFVFIDKPGQYSGSQQICNYFYAMTGVDFSGNSSDSDYDGLVWDRAARVGFSTGFNSYTMTRTSGVLNYNLSEIAWVLPLGYSADYSVSTTSLLNYMQDYSAQSLHPKILGKYSQDLFCDKYYVGVDGSYPTFVNGKYDIDLDCSGDDDFTLVGSDRTFSWFDALTLGLFYSTDVYEHISPIVEVDVHDYDLGDSDFSEKYFVALGDVQKVKSSLIDAKESKQVLYLFRFAGTKYLADQLYYRPKDNLYTPGGCTPVGYMCQEVAFLDFNIISLSYMKDGELTMFSVVSDPMDFLASTQNNFNPFDYSEILNILAIILGLIILLLLLWFFSKIVFPVLRGFFRLLKSLFSKKNNKRK